MTYVINVYLQLRIVFPRSVKEHLWDEVLYTGFLSSFQ